MGPLGREAAPAGRDTLPPPEGAVSERPMHTVPGLFERLTQLYAEGAQAVGEGRFADAVALFDRLSTAPEFEEFLTLPAYEQVLTLSGR